MRVELGGMTVGFDDRGRGTPLLLVHAFPLDRRMWEALAHGLAHEARVVTIDVRGMGESEGTGTVEEFADHAATDLAHAIASFQSAVGIAGALAALRDRPDSTDRLAEIKVPATVIVGSEDHLTPPDEARKLAAAIPGAELVEISGAGHAANLDAPEAFLEAVRGLLRRVKA